MATKSESIESFDFEPGRVLARKYVVLSMLGGGWEGEVYHVREVNTGIERAAKLFYPQRNVRNKAATRYARKLHKLRNCEAVIHYHVEETITCQGLPITMLVSEYVDGELLSDFFKRQPGKRLSAFQAVHLLYALVHSLEQVHAHGEYHGDLHEANVIVRRFGLGFELKLLDFFHQEGSKRENVQDDVCDAISIFYRSLGGKKFYAKQPDEVKYICCGLKSSLMLRRFPKATALRTHLERMQWT